MRIVTLTTGGIVSSVMENGLEATEAFPARSVAVAVKVFNPSTIGTQVTEKLPLPLVAPVAMMTAPLRILMLELASAVPVKVIIGVFTTDHDRFDIIGAIGAILSTVTLTVCADVTDWFPAKSVATAVMVFTPSTTGTHAIEKLPLPLTDQVAMTVAPFKILMVELASAVPAIVTVLPLVVRFVVVMTGAAGAVVSIVNRGKGAGVLAFH